MIHARLLMTLLIAGVFLAVLWLGTRCVVAAFAWVFRGFHPRRSHSGRRGSGGVVCRERLCRNVNVPGARFCAQCGAPLPDTRSAAGADF
jgi:hypothetical protein